MRFWIFGLAFLIPSLLDVVLSLMDTFDLIEDIQPSCNLTSNKIQQAGLANSRIENTLNDILDLVSESTFAWSALMTFAFLLVFFIGCCSHIRSRIKLKILLEVSILVSLFGPITNVNLLLRDCLAGYLTIFLSLSFYSIAVVVTSVTTEWGFGAFRLRYICPMLTFSFVTLSKAVQIVACTSSFALYFLMSSSHRTLTYTYLLFVVVQLVSMWISNIINRWKFYHFFFRKIEQLHHCCSCTVWSRLSKPTLCLRLIDITVSLLNILSCIVLISLTLAYIERDRNLFFIALVSLCISILVSLYQLPWKHCCIPEEDDYDEYDSDEKEAIIGYD